MTDYLTEQEQIQQLKNWIKQYGPTVLLGIILAVGASLWWHHWQNVRNKTLMHASIMFDEMLALRAQNNTDKSILQAKKLLSDYKNTPYAAQAALLLAREAIQKRNYTEATSHFQWIIKKSNDRSLREISRLRLARLLIAEKKPTQAITLLKTSEDKNFIGLINEIRGDAYVAMNNFPAARKAYGLALRQLPLEGSARVLLQMKYDNLTVH